MYEHARQPSQTPAERIVDAMAYLELYGLLCPNDPNYRRQGLEMTQSGSSWTLFYRPVPVGNTTEYWIALIGSMKGEETEGYYLSPRGDFWLRSPIQAPPQPAPDDMGEFMAGGIEWLLANAQQNSHVDS